jgi:G:T-mismatch repair DNA endonuclease (very short patch repair protein)
MGVIYILTNPSFPEYVKIGYADDMKKRLESEGWRVIIVWECELKKKIADERLSRLCEQIKGVAQF